jgi:hypothetical protein
VSCAQDCSPRPDLGRHTQFNVWVTDTTKETFEEAKGDAPFTDFMEGFAELTKEDPTLKSRLRQKAAEVRERNRKYPSLAPTQVTPATSSTSSGLWARIERSLRQKITDQEYDGWLSSVRDLGLKGGVLTLGVHSTTIEDQLRERFAGSLQEALEEVTDGVAQVHIEVDPDLWADGPDTSTPTDPTPAPAPVLPAPQSEEELEARWLAEDIEVQQKKEEEIAVAIQQMRQCAYQERNAAQLALKERHELQRKQRELARRQEKAALLARLAPVLLRLEGNPRLQRQYHDQEWREATGGKKNSPWETAGDLTRRAVKDAANAVKPDD